jgi:LuxR family maltose regulon positive regulatory protein
MPVLRAVPPHAVDRPELSARLDVGMDAPLTLVVAPAGSGKSVLLAQWVAALEGVEVAWIDLTAADDDPVFFARRLTAELAALDPAFAELAAASQSAVAPLGGPLIEAVAACFAATSARVVVVFDDLHRLTNRAILADLWRLVDLLPSNAHLVFSSRIDLGLGISRHRLTHGLVELRQSDLAFDSADAAQVLERITRRRIDPETAALVVQRTEGWAAGIQLTGLGLRFRPDQKQFVDALADSDRLTLDYLSEEVLDAQPTARRKALLDLSVLEEFTPGIAEAVAGVPDGVAFLTELERESMFVVAVADAAGAYRFHHLFRDLLRYRLRASDPAAEAALLRTAADWYMARGMLPAAIEALLEGRHWESALELIITRGRDVYEKGETATVARWLGRVPDDERRARPDAQLMYAILEGMSGRAALAEPIARELLADPEFPAGLRIIAQTNLAACVQFLPHPAVYLEAGRAALELLDQDETVEIPNLMGLSTRANLRALAKVSIARAHFLLGDSVTSRRLQRELLASGEVMYGPYRIHALGSLAVIDAWEGYLRRASDLADEALELAGQLDLLGHPATGDAYLARAFVAIQRGEPEAGAFALHEGYVRASANHRVQLMWIAHAAARLVDPRGTEATAVAPKTPAPPLVRDALESLARRLQRETGRPTAPVGGTGWSRGVYEDIAGHLAADEIDAARLRLERLVLPDPVPPSVKIDVQLLGAWLDAELGHVAHARERLQGALILAEREGLVKPFMRAGSAVIRLVRELPGSPDGFRRRILDRADALRLPPAQELSEPLTARELELLAYLPSRLTNAELAEICFVSLNTVKTHMAHIYRKLDANGRDAAITRARELGLLAPAEIARVG